MNFSSVKLRDYSVKTHIIVMSFLLVVTFTLMQPLSAGGLNFAARFLFFLLHIYPTVYVAWKVSGWLFNQPIFSKVSPWILLAVAGAISGIFLAPVSVFLEIVFGVVDYSVIPAKKLDYSMQSFTSELSQEWFAVIPKTTIFWPLINAMLTWELANKDNINANKEILNKSDFDKNINFEFFSTTFFKNLPKNLGSDIIYLRSEEHYLKVVTVNGDSLIFYGLNNAINDLKKLNFEGIQSHRSYWVSYKHILHSKNESTGLYLYLTQDHKVPVSRRKRKEIDSFLQNLEVR